MSVAPATGSRWGWYFAWLGVGVLFAFALLGAMTIGVFVLPFAIVATALLLRRPNCMPPAPGLLAGLALPLLYVAFLNRDGPGNICSYTATSESCTEEWSPWPFIAVAAVLVGVSVMLARRASSR